MRKISEINIPQSAPVLSYFAQKTEIDASILKVLESGRYILGSEVSAFEEEFSSLMGCRFSVGVGNGTDALEMSLRALDVGPNDIVFTVSHTAVATVAAIIRTGAIPVFVDVDPDRFTMDPDRLESIITSLTQNPDQRIGKPRAIIPVHLYGHPADMDAILAISRRYSLAVVEDCAQAHGAKLNGRRVGTFGQCGAFSFYPTKNLGAFGDGGMVITDDPTVRQKLLAIREYGWIERYISSSNGINSRLDEMQAAVLRIKLKRLDLNNQRRNQIAAQFGEALQDSPAIAPRFNPATTEHVFHLYVVRSETRATLDAYLRSHGIGTAIHYPMPVHRQPAFTGCYGLHPTPLPVTEAIAHEILSLPVYPELSDSQVEYVARTLRDFKV
jgi:dTDP-4-amino-4,6-dideoxygalactose transaminase